MGRQTALSYDAAGNLIQVTTGITTTTTPGESMQEAAASMRFTPAAAAAEVGADGAITTTAPLSLTTQYVYNVRYPGKNWLEDEISPQGVDTRYDYDATGQLTEQTVGYGASLAESTGYGYDTLGRVMTTTVGLNTPLARSDVTLYNADNSVAGDHPERQDGHLQPALSRPGRDHQLRLRRPGPADLGAGHAGPLQRHPLQRARPGGLDAQEPAAGAAGRQRQPDHPGTPPAYSPSADGRQRGHALRLRQPGPHAAGDADRHPDRHLQPGRQDLQRRHHAHHRLRRTTAWAG